MANPSSKEVTQMLLDWRNGDQAALEKLTPLVYDQLRRLAQVHMNRERPDHTLQATALVNEVYLRLIDQKNVSWQNRAHFFSIAGRIMRQILVNYALNRKCAKREGNLHKVSIDEAAVFSDEKSDDLIAINDALNKLAAIDQRLSQVVELRFFGGLSIEEAAEVLKVSHSTVERDWNTAKAWLYREIRGQKDES